MRGTSKIRGQLTFTVGEPPALVDAIVQPKTAKDCPVSASLTDDDKARLLEIKQNALATILADKLKGRVCAKDATQFSMKIESPLAPA